MTNPRPFARAAILSFLILGLSACQDTAKPPVNVAPPPVVGDAWSNPATWGGALPGATSSVTVPAGKTVVLDGNVSVKNITVLGTLVFARKDIELSANWIMVENGGAFKIGDELFPFTQKATVTLTGSDTTENVMGMYVHHVGQ